MNTAHDGGPNTITIEWDDLLGFELTVKGKWPTAAQLAEMVAVLIVEYRKAANRGNE